MSRPRRLTARRRMLPLILAGLAALLLAGVAAEAVARFSVDEQLASRAPAGVDLQTSGLVLPGLLSGQVAVRASIDAAGLAGLGVERASLVDHEIEVTRTRRTALGQVPVVVRLAPTAIGGRLGFDVVGVSLAGIEMPAGSVRAPDLPAARGGFACLVVTAAAVDQGRLVVDGRLPLRVDGSARCR